MSRMRLRLNFRTQINANQTQIHADRFISCKTNGYSFFTVGVAQLAELLIVVQVVAGSNPVTHPIPFLL